MLQADPRPLPHGGFRPPTGAERYAAACHLAAGWERGGYPDKAASIRRSAMVEYMFAGAAFRYADLPPLVQRLIAAQHPGRDPEPDSAWRWPNMQTQEVPLDLPNLGR